MTVAIWERRDDESPTAFRWFALYRNLDPRERSMSRLISDSGETNVKTLRRRLEKWSARYEWRRRCHAWDGHLDHATQLRLLDTAVLAADRQVTQTRALGNALLEPTRVLLERLNDPEESDEARAELRRLAPRDLLSLIAQTARVYPAIAQEERAALLLRRVFSHFELSIRPPGVLPVAVAGDDLTGPERPVSGAEAAALADEVAAGLAVTVSDEGPFWSDERFYLVPVLLPGVDFGLDVEPWALVDGVAVGLDKSNPTRAAS